MSSALTTCATTWPWTRASGPAAVVLRDRRRSRQHPHRRGPNAADHQRAGERQHAASTLQFAQLVPMLERRRPTTPSTRSCARVSLTEAGIEKLEKRLGIKNIYAPENYRLTRYMEAALKAQIHLPARPRLCRQGRRGGHRRRLHRPADVRPALVGRSAPGGRGQRAREDPERIDHATPRSRCRTTSASTRSSPA